MTVGQLIVALQSAVAKNASIGELKVLADGCDCWGEAGGVRVVQDDHQSKLLVERLDNMPRAESPP